jgi:hypothetical protein
MMQGRRIPQLTATPFLDITLENGTRDGMSMLSLVKVQVIRTLAVRVTWSVGLRNVEWGDTHLIRFNAWVQDSKIQGYEGIEGIAGVPALGITAIQFDFDEQMMSWN